MATKKSHLPIALIVDLILVVLFTIVGHYTHSHNFDPQGLMTTAWPFAAALVLAWLLTAIWDRPISPLATGTGVWAITVLVGLVLRGIDPQTAPGVLSILSRMTRGGLRDLPAGPDGAHGNRTTALQRGQLDGVRVGVAAGRGHVDR